jgi:hypothetical protein
VLALGCWSAAADWVAADDPPPYPGIELLPMPGHLAYGEQWTVAGNSTGIPDGTAVTIYISNTFWVNYNQITNTRTVQTTIQGGVFSDVMPFTFYGPGSYLVQATCMQFQDTEQGSVSGP